VPQKSGLGVKSSTRASRFRVIMPRLPWTSHSYYLAFPGVAASWIEFDVSENRLLESSLSAKLPFILTTLISLAASGIFITNKTQVKRRWFRMKGAL
jgi:hypothetical protein